MVVPPGVGIPSLPHGSVDSAVIYRATLSGLSRYDNEGISFFLSLSVKLRFE